MKSEQYNDSLEKEHEHRQFHMLKIDMHKKKGRTRFKKSSANWSMNSIPQ